MFEPTVTVLHQRLHDFGATSSSTGTSTGRLRARLSPEMEVSMCRTFLSSSVCSTPVASPAGECKPVHQGCKKNKCIQCLWNTVDMRQHVEVVGDRGTTVHCRIFLMIICSMLDTSYCMLPGMRADGPRRRVR